MNWDVTLRAFFIALTMPNKHLLIPTTDKADPILISQFSNSADLWFKAIHRGPLIGPRNTRTPQSKGRDPIGRTNAGLLTLKERYGGHGARHDVSGKESHGY